MKNNKGYATVVIYAIIAVVAAVALMPSWHLPAFLVKKPATQQLSADQKQLAITESKLSEAQAELAKAKASSEQKKQDQLVYSQKMGSAAAEALSRVPAVHRTPEVILAEGFVTRANNGLDAAIGRLPVDQQAEMKNLVAQALSAKQAEIDAANKTIADMDHQLATETAARKDLASKIPVLESAVTTKQAEVDVKKAEVDKDTAQVAEYADKKDAAELKAGSLEAYAGNLMHYIVIGVILYLLIHFILPCLTAEFPGFSFLGTVYRGLTSVVSAHTIAPVLKALPQTTTPPVTPPQP